MIFSSTNKGWNKLHLNSSAQLKAEKEFVAKGG